MEKTTDELMQILHHRQNADAFLQENQQELLHQTLSEFLQKCLQEKGLQKAEAIRHADLDRVYGYQIFDGKHTPGRDKLIRLAFGMKLTVEETQRLLKIAQVSPLYPRIERDVLILECLFQGKDVHSCNESLEAHELETLK